MTECSPPSVLNGLERDLEGVYAYSFDNQGQADEIRLRQSVAEAEYDDYFTEISRHHSIPVMYREVDLLLSRLPRDAVVLDVGGCWGWHWLRLPDIRPDLKVVIVDMIRDNFRHARRLLAGLVGRNVFLVHGDGGKLHFEDNSFDAYWSVQALQHVPDFEAAVGEAHRVLKPGGIYAEYHLNIAGLVHLIYKIFGKAYHIEGAIPGYLYLSRMTSERQALVSRIFGASVHSRFTEVLFTPEFGFHHPGRQGSLLGRLDARLSSGSRRFSWIAHQHSLHAVKE